LEAMACSLCIRSIVLHITLLLCLSQRAVAGITAKLNAAAARKKMRIKKGDYVAAFDNVVPEPLFTYFSEELMALAARERPGGTSRNGYDSKWLDLGLGFPVDQSQIPKRTINRTVVDVVLKEYLAPLATGSAHLASQYAGMDWWFNWNLGDDRKTDQPKNFHFDKSRPSPGTYCPPPTVSTVFYVRGSPNAVSPTSVIDQKLIPTVMDPNQMSAGAPGSVAVGFAEANRLYVFHGDRYHGVLFPPGTTEAEAPPDLDAKDDGERMAFIVNYHTHDAIKEKIGCTGASIKALSNWHKGGYSHGIGSEEGLEKALKDVDPKHAATVVEPLRLQRPASFDKHEDQSSWMNQYMPKDVLQEVSAAAGSGKWPLTLVSYKKKKGKTTEL